MAGAQKGLVLPYKANEALTKFRFVKVSGDQLVDMADTAGELVLGVIETSVSAAEALEGKAVGVQVDGVAWVEAGAANTRFGPCSTDASGRAINAATTQRQVGTILKAATGAGQLCLVLLTHAGRVMP